MKLYRFLEKIEVSGRKIEQGVYFAFLSITNLIPILSSQ